MAMLDFSMMGLPQFGVNPMQGGLTPVPAMQRKGGFIDKLNGFLNPYGGLLGEDGDMVRNQGLLGLASGLLAASGPSTTKVSLGQALGQGLQGMQQGQQGAANTLMAAKMSGRDSYFTPIQTAEGIYSFNARTGQAAPLQVGNRQILGSTSDPTLQGQLSRSKKIGDIAGETEADSTIKKPRQAKDMLSMLEEADKLIDDSTGSLGGAGVDALAGAVGISTKGAQASAKLKVLQAGLMTNMPRMEGPQSDRDVQLYKEAAGQIGNPMTPNATKKAALEIIRTIQQKYASRAPDAQQSAPAQQPTVRRRFNPATGKIE